MEDCLLRSGHGMQAMCLLKFGDYDHDRFCSSFQVRVWSRTAANAQTFAQEIGAKVCETAEAAVRGADVICTVTFATTPIVQQDWVKPGAHINGQISLF